MLQNRQHTKKYTNYILLCIVSVITFQSFSQTDLARTVNPFIGTGGHGHTFPGAVMPFGMVQLSPDTRADGSWDGCGGYHYSDSLIHGFSHTHLSGTGVSDWGDILICPSNTDNGLDGKKYITPFSHKNETAYAGYYSVKLNNGIETELTVTPRVGIHNYKFPGKKAFVYIDLLHRDRVIDCDLVLTDSFTISGYRKSEAWAKEQHCYFTLHSNKAIRKFSSRTGKAYDPKKDFEPKEIKEGALIEFDNTDGKPLMLKVAISNVDTKGATNNLQTEAQHWDFTKYKNNAFIAWNEQLGKIKITESKPDERTIFYTALYHCFIHPSLDMDCDRRYRGRDNQIHTAVGFDHYNVFSLWDTYRALHPLFTLIEQKRTNDFINTFYKQFEEGKKLPVWELSSNETNCMIGYHSVSVIADAYLKGIKNYDTVSLYSAMKASAKNKEFSIDKFYSKKFLEVNDESESVSKSLEYAYDNWCIAQMGKRMGDRTETIQLIKTAQAYKNLFDASTGFMRPRQNGNWYSPFYPNEINNHYTEGNSWHYSFYVPHDIEGLVKLHGGEKNFELKLDELFTTSSKTIGRDQADVTGLIGQYAHGNEPSHHSPFLYHYIGKPYKTKQRVTQILDQFYKNQPDGLIGNDDCGQMSAWYVLSAIGLYQVCPGNEEFVLFQPRFDQVSMHFENGKVITLKSEQAKPDKVISGFKLNEIHHHKSFVTFKELINGGSLNFEFLSKADPTNNFGQSLQNRPRTMITDNPIVPAPIISYKNKTFSGTLEVKVKQINEKSDRLSYSLNGSNPTKNSKNYKTPLFITNSTQIKAKSYKGADSSETIQANVFKLNTVQTATIRSKANPQYAAEGAKSLLDGVHGDTDWRKGDWLGYQGQDFECVIKNKNNKPVTEIALSFLQDTRSWIVFPVSVTLWSSIDGINYKEMGTVKPSVPAKDYQTQTTLLTYTLKDPKPIKYIKVVAKNFGKLPEWHDGAGGQAFIFIDEIELK